jgi:hypothetical protein
VATRRLSFSSLCWRHVPTDKIPVPSLLEMHIIAAFLAMGRK